MQRLLRFTSLGMQLRRNRFSGPVRVATAQLAEGSGNDFFAKGFTFESIELDPRLRNSLDGVGFERPSQIQALGMPPLMDKKDVVLAAETGSGKTLAYLLPLMTHLLREKQRAEAPQPPVPSPIFESGIESETDDDERQQSTPRKARRSAWVLCPSVDLCQQVQSVIESLTQGPDAVITSEISPSGFSRYSERPDILLGTPGSILAALTDMHRTVLDAILLGVGYVVVDEADLMLTGSYRSQIDRLFQMLYMNERETAIKALSMQLGLTKEAFLALPRRLRQAGVRQGVDGMIEAGYEPKTPSEIADSLEPFWRRQFVLAGATIPAHGTKNVRDEISQLFPHAEIVSTANLHKTSTQLSYNWINIEPSERMEAVLNVIQSDPSFENGIRGKILVFAKDAPAVDALASFLTEQGVTCAAFHKKLEGYYRRANLKRFREEAGAVMVSTDGLSRGLDVEGITHVIQADFAPSAVSFLHRVGRTARAGAEGKITCLCTESDRDLVDAIRGCIDSGIPVEGAFSRNRSFRTKMRRYGTFVPRGVVPTVEQRTLKN